MNRQQYIDEMAEAILENYSAEEIRDTDTLRESCWIDDAVTGNASGSFYFNSWKAKNAVVDIDPVIILTQMVDDGFIDSHQIAVWFLDWNWEAMDVSIRCYLLDEAIAEAITRLNMHEDQKSQTIG